MKDTTYGQKGGEGPTRGKKAIVYEVTFPDGFVLKKRSFFDLGDTPIATALAPRDKADKVTASLVAVWEGKPAWEGDYGRLVARKVQ